MFSKRIKTPKEDILKEFNQLIKKGNQRTKKLGLKEKNVDELKHKGRRKV